MKFLDLTCDAVASDLALDEALLLEAEAGRGGEVLRLWEAKHFAVVLGSGGLLAEEVDETVCQSDGVPILRRASGGGTVLVGPGCLCYSLVLSYDHSPTLREIPYSYLFILNRLCEALQGLLPEVTLAGTSDLIAARRKFSGNAQQRKRDHLLHHGTLLYGFDLSLMGRYLRFPSRRPDYRGQRSHEEFVCNLPTTRQELSQRLRTAWEALEDRSSWPQERVAVLVETKYSAEAWTRRR